MGVAIGPKKRNLIAAVAAFADCFLGRWKREWSPLAKIWNLSIFTAFKYAFLFIFFILFVQDVFLFNIPHYLLHLIFALSAKVCYKKLFSSNCTFSPQRKSMQHFNSYVYAICLPPQEFAGQAGSVIQLVDMPNLTFPVLLLYSLFRFVCSAFCRANRVGGRGVGGCPFLHCKLLQTVYAKCFIVAHSLHICAMILWPGKYLFACKGEVCVSVGLRVCVCVHVVHMFIKRLKWSY